MKKIYKIKGMDCPSCASLLELDLEDAGVKAKCSYANSEIEVEGDGNFTKVKEIAEKSGFKIA